jgi:PKD repeat protein
MDNQIACMPATVQFTDQSTDPTGTINKWRWDFGDGSTSTLQNPSHTFTAPGFYNIGLTITSTTGCSTEGVKYRYIRVVSGVTADFATVHDSSCKAPFGVTFSNQTSGPGILTYN